MHEQLIQTFEKIVPLSGEVRDFLINHTDVISLSAHDKLLSEGQTCKYIYFVCNGFARAYHLKDGKEITSWLMGEGEFIISVYSFFTQKPGSEYVELLKDSTLIRLSFDKLQEVYSRFPEMNMVGRILTEHYYMRSEERAISLRMFSAKERYDDLISRYPRIIQDVPLGHIASYLGITAETLSRVRSMN